jgi:isoquinoline 1-oxidoreductase alpha subunit
MPFSIKVDGTTHSVGVDGDTPLLWVLRDVLGMSGTKFDCGAALCGACTLYLDSAATRSCVTPIASIGNSAITTIEAIGETPEGKALQQAWLETRSGAMRLLPIRADLSAAALLK